MSHWESDCPNPGDDRLAMPPREVTLFPYTTLFRSYTHDQNGGRRGGARIARQDGIGSPRVQQKGDGLTCYLEFHPGLSVGHRSY